VGQIDTRNLFLRIFGALSRSAATLNCSGFFSAGQRYFTIGTSFALAECPTAGITPSHSWQVRGPRIFGPANTGASAWLSPKIIPKEPCPEELF
jgi:hypothetical protein